MRKQLPKPPSVRDAIPFPEYKDDPVGFIESVLKIQLTPEQKRLAESVRGNAETNVPAGHGLGKCIAWSELIPLSDGTEARAGDLIGKNFEVLTIEEGKVLARKAIAEFNALEPVYRITTETGKSIVRSENHPLWSAVKWSRDGRHPQFDEIGWHRVSSLSGSPCSNTTKQGRKASQLVAMPSEIPVFGEMPLPNHEVKLIAYLIGDGGLTTSSVVFTQEDNAQLAEVRDCAAAFGCELVYRGQYDYGLTQPKDKRYTHLKRSRTTALGDRSDFSCTEHVSTSQLSRESGLKEAAFYGRLNFLGIKPLKFYQKGYLSREQYDLYWKFDKAIASVKRESGIKFVSHAKAAERLSREDFAMASVVASLQQLESQLKEAKAALREEQKIGARSNGSKPNPVAEMLRKHDLMGKSSHHKTIPPAIFSLPREQCAIFLSRLYSTDGWASARQSSRMQIEIGLSSVSLNLLEAVQKLLIRFGISSSIYAKKTSWTLGIGTAEDTIKFADLIGIYGKETAVAKCRAIAVEKLKSRQVPSWRTRHAPDGCHWEKVVSVECIGMDFTVAIEVPSPNTFLTTFYEHNTKIAACCALWWVCCVGGRFISTAPTNRQVQELLWGEIRSMYDAHKGEIGGDRGMTYLRLTEAARGVGYAAADRNLDSFQGAHAENLLIIEDEANGISEEIDDGASSCLTGSSNRMLRIGNPTASGTAFEAACAETCIRLPVWSHPNVSWAYELHADGIHRLRPEVAEQIIDDKGKVIPQGQWPEEFPRDVIPGAVSIDWIERTRQKKGERSAYWMSRVEALFPEDSGAAIIPKSWFLAARARYDANPEYWDAKANRCISSHGLDVGDGGDPHAYARWQGPVLYSVEEAPTRGDRQDITRAAHFGWNHLCVWGGIMGVDQIGVGAGTLSILMGWIKERSQELSERSTVTGVNFGAKPDGLAGEEFLTNNLKSDWFLALREAFRKGEIAIAPLGEEIEAKVMRGFSLIYYEETPSGMTVIEPKSKTKKRLKRSPDPEDAIVDGFGVQSRRRGMRL